MNQISRVKRSRCYRFLSLMVTGLDELWMGHLLIMGGGCEPGTPWPGWGARCSPLAGNLPTPPPAAGGGNPGRGCWLPGALLPLFPLKIGLFWGPPLPPGGPGGADAIAACTISLLGSLKFNEMLRKQATILDSAGVKSLR